MGKKIFEVYLAKEDVPNNEAYAKLDLPASLWELWDALDKVRLQTDDILYIEDTLHLPGAPYNIKNIMPKKVFKLLHFQRNIKDFGIIFFSI